MCYSNSFAQVCRAHVQNSRKCLGSSGTFTFKDDATAVEGSVVRQLHSSDSASAGSKCASKDLKGTWQSLMNALWPSRVGWLRVIDGNHWSSLCRLIFLILIVDHCGYYMVVS